MTFDQHQEAVARWMGYDSAEEMNLDHDTLHQMVARQFNVYSFALAKSRGGTLDAEQEFLAALEEDAILHLQRYLTHARRGVPRFKEMKNG